MDSGDGALGREEAGVVEPEDLAGGEGDVALPGVKAGAGEADSVVADGERGARAGAGGMGVTVDEDCGARWARGELDETVLTDAAAIKIVAHHHECEGGNDSNNSDEHDRVDGDDA